MRIVIGGASGFLGRPLVERLRAAGHDVVRLVRREPSAPDELPWRPSQEALDPSVVDGADAAINLAGVGVGDHRWTEDYRRLIRSSRLNSTQTLARCIAAAAKPPRVLLNASAVGYYGDTGDREVDEAAPAGSGYFPELCQAWEAATAPAEEAGIRVVHLRSGPVLGPGGGLLGPMLPLFKLGLGGPLGNGRQWMPWISRADELGAIEFLLSADRVTGAVNLTGPAPVPNKEFARTLGRVLHRPALLPVPALALRVVIGEFGPESIISQRVLPAVLAGAGYRFQHSDLESALRWVVSQ
jgi:uncharacterized protein (TIGR01777 family)